MSNAYTPSWQRLDDTNQELQLPEYTAGVLHRIEERSIRVAQAQRALDEFQYYRSATNFSAWVMAEDRVRELE